MPGPERFDDGDVGRQADVERALGNDQVRVGDSGLCGVVHHGGLGGRSPKMCDGYVGPLVGVRAQVPVYRVLDDVRSLGWRGPGQRDAAVEGVGDGGGGPRGWEHGLREYVYRGFGGWAGADGALGYDPVGVVCAEGGGAVGERRGAGVGGPEFGFLGLRRSGRWCIRSAGRRSRSWRLPGPSRPSMSG